MSICCPNKSNISHEISYTLFSRTSFPTYVNKRRISHSPILSRIIFYDRLRKLVLLRYITSLKSFSYNTHHHHIHHTAKIVNVHSIIRLYVHLTRGKQIKHLTRRRSNFASSIYILRLYPCFLFVG